MFAKLIVFPILFAAVSAGYLGAPLATSVLTSPVVKSYDGLGYGAGGGYGYGDYGAGYGYGHGYPAATSYANIYKVSKSIPIIKTIAAPAVIKAPIAYGAHDLGYSSHGYGGYGHGLGYSGLGYGNGLGYSGLGYGNRLGYSGLGYGYGVGHGLGHSYGYGLYH